MSVFLTGVTGYVGKHLLRYLLSLTNREIVVCIREKRGVSARERFSKEIKQHPLFEDTLIQTNLKNVKLVEKDVSALQQSDLEGCTDVIHCAANVKFTDPLELLYKENVTALKKLYKFCKKTHFYYVSTCYVHPKTRPGPYDPTKIESKLDKSEFICEYAYTKYLAEQYLYKQKGQIDIIRLSCVGAPIESLPPMRGGAHLAIVEALERGVLPDLWMPDTFKFSVVPVDILSKGIIERTKQSHEGLQIVQYAAPANNTAYNMIGKDLVYNTTRWNTVSFNQFAKWMLLFYWFMPSIAKRITDASAVIYYVSGNQAFNTDLEFPDLSQKEYNDLTISYVKKLVKSNPKPKNLVYDWVMYLYSFVKQGLLWLLGPTWVDEDN